MDAMKGRIQAICMSAKKGTAKSCVEKAEVRVDFGIVGDAHAGNWHRQVSLLSAETIAAFRAKGADVQPGAFGENLIIEGVDLKQAPVGTRFRLGDVLLEVTQIGKECHSHCAIYRVMGDCIMPREGLFAKVLQGGAVGIGDELIVEYPALDRPLTAAVITLSDKGAVGARVDESGPVVADLLHQAGYAVVETMLLPDEQKELEAALINLADRRQVSLVITTGGTGFSVRDRTPEATLAVATRNAPGIAEAIRYGSLGVTKRAMLGRGVSVIRNQTLIINLPGSVKAVRESLSFIIDALEHGIQILRGTASECGQGEALLHRPTA
ncbi:MAG: MOSC domain-containing protein [Treponema sp.]|jgi:molybdenum cofactor synthesis domain-containing protein|nr:MOSC domain-containing protein [Treponema sp.]